MRIRRFLASFLVAVVTLGALAPVAAADPAKPTNYKSRILSITPPTPSMTLKVVGGDGFLYLHMQHGHTAAVPGYDGEPWLRVLADGTVEENQLSLATYLNANRYGRNIVFPPGVGAKEATANPQWTIVGHGGTYVWHDHRIHYMTPDIPPKLVPGTNRVQLTARADGKWVIPMTVDGHRVVVVGELLLLPAPSALPAWAVVIGVVVVVAAIAIIWRRWALPLGTLLIGLGGIAALIAGWRELAVVPTQAGGNPVAVALPIVAVVAAILSAVLRNAATRVIAVLAGAAALLAWALLRIAALDKAVPLSDLDPTLARMLIAFSLGAAVAAAVASVRSGALALAPLGDDDEDDEDDDGPITPPTALTAVED
jgi:hypothetical protein